METSHSNLPDEHNSASLSPQAPSTSTTSGWEEVRGHQLYWELHGSENERTVVLLHHGLGSVRSWRRQIPAFVARGWRVLAYDRWGYGRSDARPAFEPNFLRHDAMETRNLLDMFGIENACFVGHSDGGSIALLLAAETPSLFERLVVVAAHIYFEPKMVSGIKGIIADAQAPPLRTALKREHGDRAEDLVRAWVDHWLETDLSSLSLIDELPKITCPTLVVQGELDEHATPQHAQDIADGVKDGHLWLIPGVHHMPMHEIPENFNTLVLNFMEGELPSQTKTGTPT